MTKLSSVSSIEVTTYSKGCACGFNNTRLPNIIVTAISASNVSCTIGGSIQQVITDSQALEYINSFSGYIE